MPEMPTNPQALLAIIQALLQRQQPQFQGPNPNFPSVQPGIMAPSPDHPPSTAQAMTVRG